MRRAQLTYRATDDPRCRLVTYFVSSISSFIDPRDASARGCRRERRAVHSDFSRLSWRSRWASPRVSPRHGAVTRRARLVMRRATSPPTFASLPAAMRVEPAASVRQQPNPHEPPFKPTAAQFAVVESAADAAAREHQNRLNKALELQANLHAQRAAEMAAKRAEGGDAEGAGGGRSPKDERGGRGRSRSRTQSPRRDDRNRTRSPVKRRRSRSRSRDRGRDRSRDRDRDRDRDRYKPYSRGKRRGGKYGSGGPRNMNPNGVGQ